MELKPLQLVPPLQPKRINTLEECQEVISFLTETSALKDPVIGFDIETPPVKDYYYRRIRSIQFGNKDKQYVIDLLKLVNGDGKLLYDCQANYGANLDKAPAIKELIELIKPFLESKSILKCGVNLGFEFENFYWCTGLRPWHLYSVDIVERVIWAGEHSLKDYPFYSMAQMTGRYFGASVEKELQKSFNLADELTDDQVYYAALDTRIPLALRIKQYMNKAQGGGGLREDNLELVAQIENDVIGSFQEMHVHGQKIDVEKWNKRIKIYEVEFAELLNKLDAFFIPWCGNKNSVVDDAVIAQMEKDWKELNFPIAALKAKLKKNYNDEILKDELFNLTTKKESLKDTCSEAKKLRTKTNKLIADCEGNALINYSSNAQVLHTLQAHGFKNLKSLDDENTKEFTNKPVIELIRRYHFLSKQISTYGYSWTTKWKTKAGKDPETGETAWLHPGDGRLHSRFNQLDAETGRSSSEQPNGQNINHDEETRSCFICDPPDEEEPEGYCIVTADMSGAELRIIAEEANDPIWIGAFAKDEDVHSVGTEIMYPVEWPKLALLNGGTIIKNGKEKKIPPCAYYELKPDGTPKHEKCECPEHKKKRNTNKSANFLLAYGGMASTLAKRLNCSVKEATEIMALHESKFSQIWKYLRESGELAFQQLASYDMFGRRRKFARPSEENAISRIKEFKEEKLRLNEDQIKQNINNFIQQNGREPKGKIATIDSEMYFCSHREPTRNEIINQIIAIGEGIKRQGKNHRIQGANATIIKLALSCGYDTKEGKPFLFHILLKYKAKLLAMVHDELVVQCPKRFGEQVAFEIGDAFRRAAAEKMTKVIMKFDYKIASYWFKE